MRRTFDLSRLFEARLDEDRRKAAPYRTLAAELDAVRARRKPISMFPLARPGVEPADDAFLRTLLRAAAARGLGVLVEPGEPGELAGLPRQARGVTAYALALDQSWRVPAIAALWKTALEDGRWSDAAERHLSYLLGYSARERRVWIAQLRHRVAAWGARTSYALLDRARLALVDQLGRRCLGPAPAIEGLTFFVHGRGHALRRDAARLAPRGLAIARVGLDEAAYARLFGGASAGRRRGGGRLQPPDDARGVIEAVAGARAAAAIAAGLRSNVELLTAAGWR
jgi:hypothetical protein